MNHRLIYLRDLDNNPVGCVAYRDLRDGTFAFGISFLNSEVDSIDKKRARSIAESRLQLALNGSVRANSQDRFGIVQALGNALNVKVADMLYRISRLELHRSVRVRERMVADLMFTSNGLVQNISRSA